MDWSKAKNLIIAALIVTNLLIGWQYLSMLHAEGARADKNIQSACEFLEEQGMKVSADIPVSSEKLPVLFVSIDRESEDADDEIEYKGRPLIVRGGKASVRLLEPGQQAAWTISASEALLKLYAQLSQEGSFYSGMEVKSADLVYLLSLGDSQSAAEDTAVPAWRIVTSGGTYYIDAYAR
ncbi:MAG: hypothetical protein GX975_01560 [Clostridiales bacterium]|nr:hypothetical protein [Clostridiales bacterium]